MAIVNYLKKLTQVLKRYNFNAEELTQLMQNDPILLMHALNKLKLKEDESYVSSSFKFLLHTINQERLIPSPELRALQEKYPAPRLPPKTNEVGQYTKEGRRLIRLRMLENLLSCVDPGSELDKRLRQEYEDMEESINRQ
mgnify:CR=1 FL=1